MTPVPRRPPPVRTPFLAVVALAAASSGLAAPARRTAAAAHRPARAGTTKITIEALMEAHVPADLNLASDGARIAYTVRSLDVDRARYIHQIYVQSLPDGTPRQFTYRNAGAVHPRFSPDGRWLAFASGPAAASASAEDEETEEGTAQVFVAPVDGGEARQITRRRRGIQDFAWLPDGKEIVVLSEEDDSAAASALKEEDAGEKIDGVAEPADQHRQQFWAVDVATDEERRLSDGAYGIEPPFSVSPDGRSLVYSANLTAAPGGENAYDLYVLDIASRSTRRLTERAGAEKGPRFSPDGRDVAFVAPATPDISFSRATLFIVPAAGGAPRALSARSDRDIEEGEYRFTPDGSAVLAVVNRGTDGPIWRFDRTAAEGREIVGGTRVCSSLAVSRTRLAFIGEGPAQAPEVHVAGLDGSGTRRVTDLIPEAREWEIGDPSIIRWKSFDGKAVEGIVVKPRGYRPGKRYPLLVYPHGGPQWRDPNVLLDDRQAYAAEGYALLLPQFRGSTGYGDAWVVADMKDLGGGDFKDLMAGVDALAAMGLADPDRLGIFGGSYGGYLTNWAITQTQRFRAAVSWYGIWNLVTDFGNSFYSEWEPDYLRARYWDDWEEYISRSPARYVKNVTTPVLILHGEEDDNTSLANSREMWTALRALGKQAQFVHYPREGHGFSEPNHQKDVFRRTLRHMDRYVKGGQASEPVPGETVTAGGLQLLVRSVEREESFAGRKPKPGSIFLAVTLVLDDVRPTPSRLSLRVGGPASDVRIVDSAGRTTAPTGALAPALGESLLFAGEGELAVVPDRNGEPRTLPAILIFEVREGAGPCRLKVKDFGPVLFDLPL